MIFGMRVRRVGALTVNLGFILTMVKLFSR